MQEKLPKIHEYMKKNEGRLSKSDAVYCGMMGICWNQKTKETELWDQFTPEIIPNVLMEMEHILKARKKMHSKIVFYVAFNALKKTLQVLGRIEIPKHPTPRKAKTTMVLPTRDKNKKKSFLKAGVIDWDQVWEYQLGCASFKDAVVLSDNTTNPHLLYAVSVAYPRVARFLQKTGLPYDILFDSGREARRLSNLPVLPSGKPVGLKSSCTPLLTPKKQTELKNILKGRAPNFLVVSPMVVDVANCYTPEYKEAILQVMDSVPFVTDRGGSGTSLLRASFLRKTEKADKEQDPRKDPCVKLGAHFLRSTAAEACEVPLFGIHTELTRLFQDATREALSEIVGRHQPVGYVGWEKRYQDRADIIHSFYSDRLDLEAALEKLKGAPPRILAPTDATVFKETAGTPVSDPNRRVTRQASKMGDESSSKSTEWSSRVKNEIDKYTTDPPKYEAVDFETNLLIVKMGIGASYGPHRDGNHTLLSKHVTQRKELHNGIQLPTAKEMVVCTTCLCTNDCKSMTELHHYRGGKPSDRGGKQGKRVSNITVGSCHSHNQSPGSNDNEHCWRMLL
jgi:hypothetical protein